MRTAVCNRIAIVATLCSIVLTLSPGRCVAVVPHLEKRSEPEAVGETAVLDRLVRAYFGIEDAKQRSRLAGMIDGASHGDLALVAQAVGGVSVWTELPSAAGFLSFESAVGKRTVAAYQLPEHYDPSLCHPMIVCFPRAGVAGRDTVVLAGQVLGEAANGFVLISPDGPVCPTFHQPAGAADDVQRLLRAARREIHVDTDRVFLFGLAEGGEAAWMAAITQPDSFAGVIVLSAYPRVPFPEQVYAFLLQNMRHLPLLTVWRAPEGRHVTTRQRVVAAHNRAIVEFAQRASLPIVGVEIPGGESAVPRPPAALASEMLGKRRRVLSTELSHWFRYPAHGRTGWLRQVKFMGEVWEADQLAIAVSAAGDRDRFIADTIKHKLAYLGGRVDRGTITIETRRCARVELLLPMGLVDLTRPILVRCNGRRRYDRVLEPSVRVLLETAYEQWEFQRPVAARLSFSVRTDAPLDEPGVSLRRPSFPGICVGITVPECSPAWSRRSFAASARWTSSDCCPQGRSSRRH